MKTHEQIEGELDQLISEHYYTDDYIFAGVLRSFVEHLGPEERFKFQTIVARRMIEEGSIVNVMLCGAVDVPEAVPLLVDLLNRQEEAGQLSRAIITVLTDYKDDAAYRAVSRFLESEQECEALAAIGKIDFVRTMPHLRRLLSKNHVLDTALHMLHDRSKEVGIHTMVYELKTYLIKGVPDMATRLKDVLRRKSGIYNPFGADEIQAIEKAIET